MADTPTPPPADAAPGKQPEVLSGRQPADPVVVVRPMPKIIFFYLTWLASLVMGAGVWAVEHWLERWLPGSSTMVRAVRVGVSIGAGGALLLAMARVLRIQEFEEALRRVTRRAGGGA